MRSSLLHERDYQKSFPLLWILLIVCIGAFIRFDFLFASHFVIDSDEAIVGLMAKHIAEGSAVPVFYYGQHYMGTLEPLLVGTLFSWIGFYPFFLKIIPVLFSLFLIVIIGAIGFELQGKRGALLAAALAAIPPSTLIVWSSKARGGFIELVFLGALATLLSFWWLRQKEFGWGRLAIISFILGFGWWTNNQIVYFYPAVGLLVLWKVSRTSTASLIGLCSTAILYSTVFWLMGGLPFWLYNVVYDFASFSQLFRSHEASIHNHIYGLVETALPIILGGKRYWQTQELFPYSSLVSFLLYGGLLFFCAFEAVTTESQQRIRILFLFCVAATTITVFVLSPYGYLSEAPRYLLPLYVPLIPLVALGVILVFKHSKKLGLFLGLSLFLLHLASSYLYTRAVPGEPYVYKGERVSQDHGDLYSFLAEQHISWIRTNYWIGYRVAYETQEQVRFMVFQEPLQRRIPEYETLAAEQGVDVIPYVLVPSQATIVKSALEISGYSFKEVQRSGYTVLYDLAPPNLSLQPVSRELFVVQASDSEATVENAFDGDAETRWGSGRPQSADMELQITFSVPQKVSMIEYELGDWKHDFPRALKIEGVLNDGTRETILTRDQYQHLRYIGTDEMWRLFVPAKMYSSLHLKQLGSDTFFDWSVAEIQFFTSSSQP